MIILILGLLSGIVVKSLFSISLEGIFLFLILGIVLWALSSIRNKYNKNFLITNFISIFLILFSLGMFRVVITDTGISKDFNEFSGEKIRVSGFIGEEPTEKDTYTSFVLKARGVSYGEDVKKVRGKILVKTSEYDEIFYGDGIIVEGKLESVEEKYVDLPSYVNYLKKDGILHEISFAKISKTGTTDANFIIYKLLKIKHGFLENLRKVMREPHAGIAGGMTVAGKGAMEKSIQELFTQAGIVHIVVLSGFNITLIANFILILLTHFGRITKAIAITLTMIFFVLMSGGSPPVVRSSLMASVALLGKLNYRSTSGLRLLTIISLGMILWNPYILLFDPSFQLTVLATFAIIEISPKVILKLKKIPEGLGLREIISQTISASLFLLPFLLYKMGSYSIAGFFVNLLVVPLVSIITILSFITGILGFIPSLAFPSAFLSDVFISWIIGVSKVFTSIPFAVAHTEKFSSLIMIVTYALFLFLMYRRRENNLIKTNPSMPQ